MVAAAEVDLILLVAMVALAAVVEIAILHQEALEIHHLQLHHKVIMEAQVAHLLLIMVVEAAAVLLL
jgi:hypothetical protein